MRALDADGILRTGHFDEITTEDIRPALYGLIVRKTKNGNGTAFEFKVGSSKLSANQKAVDDTIKGGKKGDSHLAETASDEGLTLPYYVDSVHQLRIPIDALPRDELISAMRSALAEKGMPRHAIDDFKRKFDTAYGLNRTLRANGLDDLADGVTIARVLGADESSDETRDRRERSLHYPAPQTPMVRESVPHRIEGPFQLALVNLHVRNIQ